MSKKEILQIIVLFLSAFVLFILLKK